MDWFGATIVFILIVFATEWLAATLKVSTITGEKPKTSREPISKPPATEYFSLAVASGSTQLPDKVAMTPKLLGDCLESQ